MFRLLLPTLVMLFAITPAMLPQEGAKKDEWIPLFNGKNLDGWTPKFAKHNLGENFNDTFRVEDGILRVAYDKYAKFDGEFGHLFYKDKFSHYVLRVEYRFVATKLRVGRRGRSATAGPCCIAKTRKR